MSKKQLAKKQSPLKIAVIITLTLFVLIVALVVIKNSGSEDGEAGSFDTPPSLEGQPVMGEESAPVTVTVFGDYMCPSCKAWEMDIFPQLEKDYITTGDVKLSAVNVLFHGQDSETAALASEQVLAEDPKSFWDFHHKVFESQAEHGEKWVTPNKMAEIAEETTSVDPDELVDKLSAKTFAEQLQTDTELYKKYNVQSTPTIMINGKTVNEVFDYNKIKEMIDEELGNAK
ncbi:MULTISPECIES: DsbA family protein [Bacillus]|uniref:Dihydroneopterin aldolase n=2 Tax=Bacillus TaxID=1386 RepID=A0A0M3RA05_9BACI|nr:MULTISPECIES: thioredoxin domain-containing protein [Bacillus]ALC82336.1 dihydroneopterin aldolase [Bacillus gobiensis]MBP1081202.1 protein-disulfide isomerase [Bacillus capparidis]MED1095882.1 thioredoxin domain-containing protein [Bacillus capparidis]